MLYAFLTTVSFFSTKLVGLERTIVLFKRIGGFYLRVFPKRSREPEALYESVKKGYSWLPFAVRCLDQAVVTWFVLNINGHPATLKIGVTLSPLASHAWVELEGKIFVDSYWIPDMEVLASYPAWRPQNVPGPTTSAA